MSSFLIEIKVPWEGWRPYKVFHGPLSEILHWLPKWFTKKELHEIRFRRVKDAKAATESVIEYWGKA